MKFRQMPVLLSLLLTNAGVLAQTSTGGQLCFIPTGSTTPTSCIELPAGPPGPQGPKGDPGKDGAVGPIGPQGPQGVAGKDGAVGLQGPQGIQGTAGPTGPQGVAGKDGAVGPQGVAGKDGASGPQGVQGVAGKDGAAGPTGPQGIQGVQGAPGAQGSVGLAGAAGAPGPQGVAGPTGPAGSRGPTGPQGVEGPVGVQGPQGQQGPQGPTGATGNQGIQGIQGATGVPGPQGPKGPTGPTGTQGVQGIQGPQGPKGDTGPTGPTGPAADSSTVSVPPLAVVGPTGEDASQYTMTFDDEFNGTSLDTAKWNDHQWYENNNPTVNYAVENGALEIWPQRDSTGNFFDRTLTTDGKFSQAYGFYEIEAKLPYGKGTWPAFWLYGHPCETSSNTCRPEIDVMEAYAGGGPGSGWSDSNLHPNNYGMTLHQANPDYSVSNVPYATKMRDFSPFSTTPVDLSASFHKYGVKWDPMSITFYFDGKPIGTSYADTTSYYKQAMYLNLDLAFGSVSGTPDSTTPTGKSNAYVVNYIRVWKHN